MRVYVVYMNSSVLLRADILRSWFFQIFYLYLLFFFSTADVLMIVS
jgi:hypothetical protein